MDLSNIRKLEQHLGDPHKNFKSIHVAGTNGKGSVSHMLASVLQEAGLKVGLYTSPHLKDFRERIRINGKVISEESVVRFITENCSFLEKENFSFFEMTVGMAFKHFSEEKVDIAIIEVGLGGRLDSTNIITPELSVITNIGFDHTAFLGNRLDQIAGEKAGIIKEKVPVIIGESHPETLPVFRKIAEDRQAPLFLAEEYSGKVPESDLKGSYQKKNILSVLTSVKILKETGWKISPEDVEKGLARVVQNTGLRGRWEVLQRDPKVICDTAHNKEGLVYTMKQLQEEDFENLHIILGVVNDKDLAAVLPIFPENALYYFCRPDIPRGLDAEDLKEKAGGFGLEGDVFSSVSKACETAINRAGKGDVIYVGGSTFTVAEII